MRKVIASEFVSLDGYMVGPNEDISWVMNSFNAEMSQYEVNLMKSMDTILLGRVTYEIMANHWPCHPNEPGAAAMNSTPKIVFSKTLARAEWGKWNNARLVKGHVVEEIAELKQLSGKDMVIYGSANLVQNFSRLGLIDEYHLLVHPLVLGGGKRLFTAAPQALNLTLTRTECFKNGVILMYYERERK